MSLKPVKIPNPLAYGNPGLFLLSYLTSIQGKQKTTVWLSKTIYSHENLWWKATAVDDSSNLEKNLNISFLSIVHKPLSIILGLLIFTTEITTEFFSSYPLGPGEVELKILLIFK